MRHLLNLLISVKEKGERMNENEYELSRDIEPNKVRQKTSELGRDPGGERQSRGTEKKNTTLEKEE